MAAANAASPQPAESNLDTHPRNRGLLYHRAFTHVGHLRLPVTGTGIPRISVPSVPFRLFARILKISGECSLIPQKRTAKLK